MDDLPRSITLSYISITTATQTWDSKGRGVLLSTARSLVGPRGLKFMRVARLTIFDGSEGSRTFPFGGPRFLGRPGSVEGVGSLICLTYERREMACWQ